MESLSPSHPGVPRIAAGVQASLQAMVAAAIEAIWAEVPAYPDSGVGVPHPSHGEELAGEAEPAGARP